MTKIAMLTTAAVIAFATPAFAKGWTNGIGVNGLSANSLTSNAVSSNALTQNELHVNGNGLKSKGPTGNSVIAHAPPSDFCAQGDGDMIAHSPPSEFCAQGAAQPVGFGFGGLDGMKVMSIELPR